MDLREYLFRHEMRICDFAEKVGYTPKYISGVISGLYHPSMRLAKIISNATGGIVPYDGLCIKKRGRALRLAKKACQGEQMTFAEMSK